MIKAERISIQYERATTVEVSEVKEELSRYISEGYAVKLKRNGYYCLARPAKVWVTCYGMNGVQETYNMSQGIISYYMRNIISEKIVKTFQQDFSDGKLSIKFDRESYSII